MDKYYVYASHLGGIYIRFSELEDEDLYCETCNDSDTFMGVVYTYSEFQDMFPESDRDYLIDKWRHTLIVEETYGREDGE